MGPGGLCGLQIRWQQSFDWCGGFDSLALPPKLSNCFFRPPIGGRFVLEKCLQQFLSLKGWRSDTQTESLYGLMVSQGYIAIKFELVSLVLPERISLPIIITPAVNWDITFILINK